VGLCLWDCQVAKGGAELSHYLSVSFGLVNAVNIQLFYNHEWAIGVVILVAFYMKNVVAVGSTEGQE